MGMLTTHDFVAAVFREAHRTNIDPAVMAFALADVLAAHAATLELSEPAPFRQSIEQRLDAFNARVLQRYPEIKEQMLRRRRDAAVEFARR